MFKLVVDGVTIGFTEKPRFVRVKPESGAFVETTQDKAEGVAYKSKVFNLFGHEIGGVEETVSVVPYDGGDDSKSVSELRQAENDLDAMTVDHELRLSMLEMGLEDDGGET